ncbi:MAG TPA: winged helix-turn-helix transcriptional regulator [Candidatus Thermoplasmatota archaeon]|nr:winged helix-turn-helix transcriptional regulator [Candidatus Thermoplasmatota archaeon]
MSGALLLVLLGLGLVPAGGPSDLDPGLPEQDIAAGPVGASTWQDGVQVTTDLPEPIPGLPTIDTALLPCPSCPLISIQSAPAPAQPAPAPASRGTGGPVQAIRDAPPAVLVTGSSLLATVLAVGLWALRPALGLFSRIEDGDLASHPLRRQALDYISANPGATLQDVRRSLGVAWGTAVYHLGRLERAGKVAVRHVGGRRGHWPLGQAPAADALAPTGQALVTLVRERPGLSQLELARLAGIGAPAACKQLRRLVQAGAVLGERAGRTVLYRPAEHRAPLLAAA